ncbi:MAG: hypothetical protein RIC87_18070 [Kiloniellales bacterium]
MQCGSVFSRVFWYFSPYDRHIESLRAFAPFTEFPLEVPSYIDPAAVESEASRRVQKKVKLQPPIKSEAEWRAEIEAADVVLVWQKPGLTDDEIFPDVDVLRRICGPEKFHLVDEERVNTAASMMMKGALSLMADEEEMIAESKRKLATFRERITLPVGYVFGTGPSLEEAWRYDYSDGHTIVCNSIVKNAPLVDHLNPIALMAGDPIFHAGPSTYAMMFRQYLLETMTGRDFHVFVPWRDYSIYLTYFPEELHERFIGIPMMSGDDYNLNIEEKFAILGLPNVLTLLLLPVAATYFDHVGISGCDGRPLSQDSYFWGHHKASQFGDQMDAIQLAHPGFFAISYNDYYLRHCSELERFCTQMESVGKTVHAITGSFIPSLRKRGAAEPMVPPKGEAEAAPVVLTLAPDLNDQQSEDWSQALNLSPKIQGGGHPFWLSGNLLYTETLEKKEEDTLPATIDRVTFNLTRGSDSLFNADWSDQTRSQKLHDKVKAEVRAAVESALLATEGRVHAFLKKGSLYHAAFVYEVMREQPRLSAHIGLHWFSSSEAWSSDFLKTWGWLLREAEQEPRLTLVCDTSHQSDALYARSGVRLAVSPQPSMLLDDDDAWQQINTNRPREAEARIYFAANGEDRYAADHAEAMATSLRHKTDWQDQLLVFEGLPPEQANKALGIAAASETAGLQAEAGDAARFDWLSRCKAVVLPHLPPDYADRPVALAIDSIYLDVPFVAQRGTAAAELAKTYRAGVIADDDRPDNIVRALADIERQRSERSEDREHGGKAYFRHNSWQRLAQQIIESLPTPEEAPLVEAAIESEVVAVPLIGPLPRDQRAVACEVQAAAALLATMGAKFPQAKALKNLTDARLQMLSSNAKSLVICEEGSAAGALADSLAEQDSLKTSVDLLALPEVNAQTCLKPLERFVRQQDAESATLLVVTHPGLSADAIDLVEATRPLGGIFAFDDAIQSCHAELANRLDALGYLVIVSEHYPHLRPDEADSTWRIAAYPFLSDLPWARGQLLALPPNASLGYIRHLLLQTGSNMEYVDLDDPGRIGMEIWNRSEPMNEARTLAYAEAPGDIWRREAFRLAGRESNGATRLHEGPNARVHRTYISGQSRAGEPLTFAIDCAPQGRRFAMLWITDGKNKTRLGTIFDLETGLPVSTDNQLGDPTIDVQAASVIIDKTDEGKPLFRVWITISRYPVSETIHAHLLTRQATTGSRQHQGEPGLGLLARDMLLEAWDVPSRVR